MKGEADPLSQADVVAAIVTYGRRDMLLLPVLERLYNEGVGHVILIDNGATWPVSALIEERFARWVTVVTLGGNTGSACGFAAALRHSYENGRRFIWLLDDDNLPRAGCLRLLLEAYVDEAAIAQDPMLAVVAARAEHATDRISQRQLLTRWDSFGGFHVADVLSKIVHRLSRRTGETQSEHLRVGVTHFGGMLFTRSLIDQIGLPRVDFFMYADDTEYTWRITARGGRIIRVANAIVDDLQPGGQRTSELRNRFVAVLLAHRDFRAFYAARNLAFFERNHRCRRSSVFSLNRWVYFGILRYYAYRLGRLENYRFVREAAMAGLAGELGPNPRFPLR